MEFPGVPCYTQVSDEIINDIASPRLASPRLVGRCARGGFDMPRVYEALNETLKELFVGLTELPVNELEARHNAASPIMPTWRRNAVVSKKGLYFTVGIIRACSGTSSTDLPAETGERQFVSGQLAPELAPSWRDRHVDRCQ